MRKYLLALLWLCLACLSSHGQTGATPLFSPVGSISSETEGFVYLESPVGSTVDDSGNVYVVDSSQHRIFKFTPSGQLLLSWGVIGEADGQLNRPVDIVVGSDDHLFVLDAGNNRVQKFDTNGNHLLSFGSTGINNGEFMAPTAITADGDGHIYVSESGLFARVQKFNLMGGFVDKFGGISGAGALLAPKGLAITSDNTLLIADQQKGVVLEYSDTGLFLQEFSTVSNGINSFELSGPCDVAVDGQGTVYILDQQSDGQMLYSTNADYVLMDINFGNGSDDGGIPFFGVNSIGIDSSRSRVFVTDGGFGGLIRLTSELESLWRVGSNSLSGIGQLGQPGGVAVGPESRIYISDQTNQDIKVFSSALAYANVTFSGAASGDGVIEDPGPLAVDDEGEIVFLDAQQSIKRFDSNGLLADINRASSGQSFREIYMEPDGSLWITIQNDGEPTTGGALHLSDNFGIIGSFPLISGLINPFGVTRNANGDVLIADVSRNNIFRFSYTTDLTAINGFAAPKDVPTQMDDPHGIARDHRGNILVVDRRNHRILKYGPEGTYIGAYGTHGAGLGEFGDPFDLAVDADGRIYVAEAENRRIQVLDPCQIINTRVEEICAGEQVEFEGTIYRESGVYERVFTSQEGCDSIVRLNLTVLPPIETAIDSIICGGEQVAFLNTLLTQPGVYRDTFQAVNGCDSVVTLDLTVAPNYAIDTTLGICQGGALTFGDTVLTTPGAYTRTFTSISGCDSTVTLTLQVLDTVRTTRTDTICQGDTLQVGDQEFFSAGTAEVVFPANAQRCDSIVTVNLTVLDTFRTVRFDTICQGEQLLVGDSVLRRTDVHEVIFPPTAERCDSTVEVHLTVLDTFRTVRFDTICRGEVLTIDTFSFSEPEVYEIVYPRNTMRCDSVVEVHLAVLDTFRTVRFDTICAGGQLQVGDQAFQMEGTYEVVFPRNRERCDSTVEVNLTVLNSFETIRTDTICQGESLQVGGQTFTQTGLYEVVFPRNQARCDSTVIIDLTVLPTFRTVRFDTLCGGESLQIGDSVFTETGTFTYVFPPNDVRCDSTVEVNLHVLPAYREVNTVTICEGDTFRIDGQERTTSGQIVFPAQTREGCDSSLIYNVRVLPRYDQVLDTSICIGEQLVVGNTRFASPGTFFYTFPATETRCDSTLEIRLRVKDTFDIETEQTICQGDTIVFGDQRLFEPGDYQYTFPENDRRCDSTVLLRLNVLEPRFDTLNLTLCPDNVLFIGTTRIQGPGHYDTRLTAANGCDSLIHIRVTERPPKRTFLEERVCEADGYPFAGEVLRQSGTYLDTLQAENGCDSIVRLQLTVDATLINRTERSICAGEAAVFGGETLTETGLYRDSFLAQTGCYFFLELDLTVHPVYADTTFAEICAGQNYVFENEQYEETGWYAQRYQTEAGCDSVRYLQLEVEAPQRTFFEQTICAGDTVMWRGQLLTREGTYYDTLQTEAGCDSVLSFFLNVLEPAVDTIRLDICGQEEYAFGSFLIDSSGVYTDTLTNRLGCDSIVTLDITFEQAPSNLVTVGGILMSANIDNARYQWVNCRDTSAIPEATTQFFIPEVNGSYAVIIETDECTYLSECFEMNVGVTSTNRLDISQEIGLFPNPVREQFRLDLGDWAGRRFNWSIVDMQGRRLAGDTERLEANHRIDVQQLPPGLYWLRLQTEEGHLARLRFVRAGQ